MQTIKASDLRIGNLIWDSEENKYFEVEQLKKYVGSEIWVFYRNGSIKCKEVEPIPLTEEWLLKFGFEKNSYWYKDDNLIRFVFDDNGWLHCSIGDNDKGILYNKIKFVHQLQNLYFALNNEELKFKE